jgi:hypothetical protein
MTDNPNYENVFQTSFIWQYSEEPVYLMDETD